MQDTYWPRGTVLLRWANGLEIFGAPHHEYLLLQRVFYAFPARHFTADPFYCSPEAFERAGEWYVFRGVVRVATLGETAYAMVEGLALSDPELADALDHAGAWLPQDEGDLDRARFLLHYSDCARITRIYERDTIVITEKGYVLLTPPLVHCMGARPCTVNRDCTVAVLNVVLRDLPRYPVGLLAVRITVTTLYTHADWTRNVFITVF